MARSTPSKTSGVSAGDLDLPAADPQPLPGRAGRGDQPDLAPDVVPGRHHVEHHGPDRAGRADDRQRRPGRPARAGRGAHRPVPPYTTACSSPEPRSKARCAALDGHGDVALVDDHRDPDLRRRDHLDVHARRRPARRRTWRSPPGASASRPRSARPCRSGRRRAATRSPPRPAAGRSAVMAAWPSSRGSVNEMSVRPVAAAETFCTIMSMLISAAAMARKIRAASPTLSGTPTTVIFASLRSCATPEMIACSIASPSVSPSPRLPR